jgi:hypothetical protein
LNFESSIFFMETNESAQKKTWIWHLNWEAIEFWKFYIFSWKLIELWKFDIIEQSWRQLGVCCMEKNMPLELWGGASMCATHELNRTITSNNDVTPFDLWREYNTGVSYFRTFGSPVFTPVPDELRRKSDPKAVKCIFVGYCENSKSFRMLNPATRNPT